MSSQESHDAISRSDQLFCALEKKKLQGLLEIEVDDTFLNREHRCVSQVALVVSLDRVAVDKNQSIARALQQVLDAVASLCVFGESLRGNKDQFNSFWMRVMSSAMMKTIRMVSTQSTLTCLHAVGFHVRLSWHDQPLQPTVFGAIRGFLNAPRAKYERFTTPADGVGRCRPRVVRPLQVAIDLSSCQLKATHITRLMETLRVPLDDPHAAMLCEGEVLRALHLTGNPLDTADLTAIAKLLEAPSIRRIDSLGLINAMPHDVTRTTSKPYIAVFKRVMVAAFRSKIAAHKDHGFALSLARNHTLQPSHIVALHEVLVGTGVTRPLRALSFAGIAGGYDATWIQIAKLQFGATSALAITTTEECELDLSAGGGHVCIVLGLTQLVREATPATKCAFQAHVPVYCRVLGRTPATEGLSRSTLHKVVAISTTNGLLLSVAVPRCSIGSFGSSGANAESVLVRSLTADEISCVRIGDTDIIRSRFTNLVLDAKHHRDPPNLRLLEAMGPDLKRLALRKYGGLYTFLEPVLACCSRIEELNLNHSQIRLQIYAPVNRFPVTEAPLWTKLTTQNWRSLQVISVKGVDAGMGSHLKSVTALKSVLADVPELALHHLLCWHNDGGDRGEVLRVVGDILRENRSIQGITIGFRYVDRERGAWSREPASGAMIRADIDHELRAESLSVESRVAFLGVLPRLPALSHQHLDNGVIAQIFRFANAKKTRTVTWN